MTKTEEKILKELVEGGVSEGGNCYCVYPHGKRMVLAAQKLVVKGLVTLVREYSPSIYSDRWDCYSITIKAL